MTSLCFFSIRQCQHSVYGLHTHIQHSQSMAVQMRILRNSMLDDYMQYNTLSCCTKTCAARRSEAACDICASSSSEMMLVCMQIQQSTLLLRYVYLPQRQYADLEF